MTIWNSCGVLLVSLLIGFSAGCGTRERVPENAAPTSPVTGVVQIDGQPAGGVRVTATPEPGGKIAYPVSATSTDSGAFAFSTYRSGDGLPEGKYVLTFEQVVAQTTGAGSDRLKGRYADPKKSEHSVQVTIGSPVDLGRVDLKSK